VVRCLRRVASHRARASFKNNIHLGPILIAEVEELDGYVLPASLSSQLLEDERLKQLTESSAICPKRRRIEPQQGGRQACIADVQLGCLDQAAKLVAVPRRQMFEQEYPLEQRGVVADGRSTQLEWAAQLRHVQ
jgi:hypothetical protein